MKLSLLFSVGLLGLLGCSGSEGTISNCGKLQQSCLDKGMCLVSTNSGSTGGSAGGSYGAGGVSANGSVSDSASCGFSCSECGDGGSKQALSTGGNCNGATINAPGATINCGGEGSSSNSSPTSSGSSGTGTSSSSGGSSTNYGPWSSCFDPSEKYPTGVLKYANCTAYCQSFGKSLAHSCTGPNPAADTTLTEDNTLVWCGLPSGNCGDVSQYPNYISQCSTSGTRTSVCIRPVTSGLTLTMWSNLLACPGEAMYTIPTSAQCCCG